MRWRWLLGLGRYAAGMAVSCLVFPIEGGLVYLGLLVVAGIGGFDGGGPLAGPFLVLLAAVLGLAVTLLVELPAVLFGELRGRGRPVRTLLLAGLGAVVLLAGWIGAATLFGGLRSEDAVVVWAIVGVMTALPLSGFLAVTYGPVGMVGLIRRRRSRSRDDQNVADPPATVQIGPSSDGPTIRAVTPPEA